MQIILSVNNEQEYKGANSVAWLIKIEWFYGFCKSEIGQLSMRLNIK